MVSCANITIEKIRARLSFGTGPDELVFETPLVSSFTVSRSRSSLPSTFSASIRVPATQIFPVDQEVIIEAGTEGNLKRLFTGRVSSITVNPSFEDAGEYTVNLSGQDRFEELVGKNISRRQRTRGFSTFAAITGVTSRAPQKGLSIEQRKQSGGSQRIVNPDTNIREHSKLVRTDRIAWDPMNPAKDPESAENRDQSSSAGGSVLKIRPASVALSPGISVRFSIEGATYEEGDTWSVSDTNIGTIIDNGDGTATYTQQALGENVITFTEQDSSLTGTATAIGIPIHDHSSLGQGGPAFAVFGSE
jgi:hypothetical protein